jgi:tetratricopeptide (TPR) repeat protein
MLPIEPQDDEAPSTGSMSATAAAANGADELVALEREQRWQELAARLIEKAEAGGKPAERVADLLRAAVVFETRLDEADKALLILQTAFQEDASHEEVGRHLGRLATGLGRWRQVVAECEEALPALPTERRRAELMAALSRVADEHLDDPGERVRLHLQAAALFESVGDRPAAVEHYRQVLTLRAGESVATTALARLLPETAPAAAPFPAAPSASEQAEESTAALAEASRLAFTDEKWAEARSLGARALARPGLTRAEKAELSERVGRACLALGDAGDAVRLLGPGVEAAPEHRGCREAMVQACEQTGDEAAAGHHRQALLWLLGSDQERFELLVRAARRLREQRKDDVAGLKLLMQVVPLRATDEDGLRDALHEALDLASESRDWKGAVQVLERLTTLATGKDRARYLVATANVLNYQLHAVDQAVELYNEALDEDPEDLKTFERIERILTAKRAWRDEARNFRRMLKRIGANPPPEKRAVVLMLWKGLGETCRTRLKDLPAAAAAYEVCATLDPGDLAAQEILAEILERQGPAEAARALEKRILLVAAARAPADLVRHIQALVKLHAEQRQPDRMWCACAALVALGAADRKQTDWYQRFINRPPRVPRGGLNEEMWQRGVYHPAEDRRLSQLFATISPALSMAKAREARGWGLSERKRAAADGSTVAKVLTYVSTVLGLGAPPLYFLRDRPGDVDLANVVDHQRLLPSFVAGGDLLRERPEREVAFILGRALALLRFEHLVLWPQVVAAAADLRALLLAILRLFQPATPVPAADQAAVKQHLALLQRALPPHAHEPLMALVELLGDQAASADVAGWAHAAFLTANRAGLLACGDPVTATQLAAPLAPSQGIAPEEAITDLIRWCVSPEHLAIREQLGIAVEA